MDELNAAEQETARAERALAVHSSRTLASLPSHKEGDWWSTHNAMTMCAALLLFSLLVLLLATYLIRLGKTANSVLQIFGTILVITMATFLVVAGYSDQQVAAPLGLLGTVAGYLLGRGSAERKDTQHKEDTQ